MTGITSVLDRSGFFVHLEPRLTISGRELVSETLEPFYRAVATEEYQLAAEGDSIINWLHLKDAIRLITQENPGDLVAISYIEPWNRPDWMPLKMFKSDLVWDLVSRTVRMHNSNLESLITKNIVGPLFGNYPKSPTVSEVVGHLSQPFYKVVRKRVSHLNKHISVGNIFGSVWHFMMMAYHGQEKVVEQLAPIVSHLAHCLPLSFQTERPTTWLVVCA